MCLYVRFVKKKTKNYEAHVYPDDDNDGGDDS
jgi:hypothetical protein